MSQVAGGILKGVLKALAKGAPKAAGRAARGVGRGAKRFGSYAKNNKLHTAFGALGAYQGAEVLGGLTGVHPLDDLMGTEEREMEMTSEEMPDALRAMFDQTEAQVGEDFLGATMGSGGRGIPRRGVMDDQMILQSILGDKDLGSISARQAPMSLAEMAARLGIGG